MRGLYVGRFQPFHLGHLSVVKDMINKFDQIIIGIGSAEDNYLPQNPFTGSERFEMIESALIEAHIPVDKIYIIPIRNINNYALWVDHLALLLPKFDVVYSGSPIVKQLFEKSGRYEVFDAEKIIKVSATMIRNKILNNDETWKNDVSPSVVKKIYEINGITRLQELTTT